MDRIVNGLKFTTIKMCKYSSSIAKNGNKVLYGRSASIFRENINYWYNL
ncbi:MAG: hypothetical protein PHX70_01620 [Clostridium sp.]|nr:hypothetical protein [Clostridium sp.]